MPLGNVDWMNDIDKATAIDNAQWNMTKVSKGHQNHPYANRVGEIWSLVRMEEQSATVLLWNILPHKIEQLSLWGGVIYEFVLIDVDVILSEAAGTWYSMDITYWSPILTRSSWGIGYQASVIICHLMANDFVKSLQIECLLCNVFS